MLLLFVLPYGKSIVSMVEVVVVYDVVDVVVVSYSSTGKYGFPPPLLVQDVPSPV